MVRHSGVRGFLKLLAAVSVTAGALGPGLLARASPAPAATSSVKAAAANLLFSDGFSGTSLDTSKWHTCFWWATDTCSIETNSELELYTKNNVSVSNGSLKLEARQESAVGWNGKTYGYTSGMISTGGRSGQTAPGFTFKYGYVEARVKVPGGQGLWPAFWLLPADYSWPPEIDVMEILGNQTTVQNMTYHYLDSSGAQKSAGGTWSGPDFSAGWHNFGVDWEPNAITYYVDGVVRWQFTDAAAITNKPSYILFNLAVGGNWPGPPNASTTFPSDYLVDYVRVWDHVPPVPPSAYATAVMSDSPVSYWRLGETSGTLAADSVGSNPGAYRSGVTLAAPSLVAGDAGNPAASFNGVSGCVVVHSASAFSPTATVSLEAWVHPAALPGAGGFASIATKAESYSLQFNGPRLEFTTMQNGTRRRVQARAGTVVAGKTYYVAGTFDGTTQRLFVNGVQVASGSYAGPLSVNTNSLVIGSWDASSEFLSGVIDEVAAYNTALSSAQIANHYNRATVNG